MKFTSFKEAWSTWRMAGIDDGEARHRLRYLLLKIGIKSAGLDRGQGRGPRRPRTRRMK